MSRISIAAGRQGLLIAAIIAALIVSIAPLAMASESDGHIGGKPDIGQGDGIPQDKPGTIRSGEQNQDGDANVGEDPAQDGGDGIPNGGPIEGDENGDQGNFGSTVVTAFYSLLLVL